MRATVPYPVLAIVIAVASIPVTASADYKVQIPLENITGQAGNGGNGANAGNESPHGEDNTGSEFSDTLSVNDVVAALDPGASANYSITGTTVAIDSDQYPNNMLYNIPQNAGWGNSSEWSNEGIGTSFINSYPVFEIEFLDAADATTDAFSEEAIANICENYDFPEGRLWDPSTNTCNVDNTVPGAYDITLTELAKMFEEDISDVTISDDSAPVTISIPSDPVSVTDTYPFSTWCAGLASNGAGTSTTYSGGTCTFNDLTPQAPFFNVAIAEETCINELAKGDLYQNEPPRCRDGGVLPNAPASSGQFNLADIPDIFDSANSAGYELNHNSMLIPGSANNAFCASPSAQSKWDSLGYDVQWTSGMHGNPGECVFNGIDPQNPLFNENDVESVCNELGLSWDDANKTCGTGGT